MALGDGIRRNVATISAAERARLRDAFLKLDTTKLYPDYVSYWDKQEEIHKDAHAAGADVHRGPAFLPWHRDLCNRLEALLREVDPELSLHYWDWTTDPRSSPDGAGGTVNLFTPEFMGSSSGDAGAPFQDFESTEPGQPRIWRNVRSGAPQVPTDQAIVTSGDDRPIDEQFHRFRIAREVYALELVHNEMHGYIGGTLGDAHFSFHDPFVFLLHSNVDRLWAMWQRVPGKEWRLDPNLTYGIEGTAPSITANLEPWAGLPLLRPWAPPDNEQLKPENQKNSKHPSVVNPPRFDSTEPPHTVSPSAYHFGAVYLGTQEMCAPAAAEFTFQIANNRPRRLSIVSISDPPLPFSIVGTRPAAVNPSETKPLTVRFAPTALGEYSATIAINFDADPLSLTLALRGRMFPAERLISASPLAHRFGTVTVGSAEKFTFRIRNSGQYPLTITDIRVTGVGDSTDAEFSIVGPTWWPRTINCSRDQQFTLRFAPTELGQVYSAVVRIVSDAKPTPLELSLAGKGSSVDIGGDCASLDAELHSLQEELRSPTGRSKVIIMREITGVLRRKRELGCP